MKHESSDASSLGTPGTGSGRLPGGRRRKNRSKSGAQRDKAKRALARQDFERDLRQAQVKKIQLYNFLHATFNRTRLHSGLHAAIEAVLPTLRSLNGDLDFGFEFTQPTTIDELLAEFEVDFANAKRLPLLNLLLQDPKLANEAEQLAERLSREASERITVYQDAHGHLATIPTELLFEVEPDAFDWKAAIQRTLPRIQYIVERLKDSK